MVHVDVGVPATSVHMVVQLFTRSGDPSKSEIPWAHTTESSSTSCLRWEVSNRISSTVEANVSVSACAIRVVDEGLASGCENAHIFSFRSLIPFYF